MLCRDRWNNTYFPCTQPSDLCILRLLFLFTIYFNGFNYKMIFAPPGLSASNITSLLLSCRELIAKLSSALLFLSYTTNCIPKFVY